MLHVHCALLKRNLWYIGGLQLVPIPCHVCSGHPLRDDDPDQLVQPLDHHRHHLLQQQLRRHVGEDHLLLAGGSHLPLVHDRPCSPGWPRLWLLIYIAWINGKPSPESLHFFQLWLGAILQPKADYLSIFTSVHKKLFKSQHIIFLMFMNESEQRFWSDTKLRTGALQYTQNLIQVASKVY